ncbi:hypothetical protein [Terracidiphilus sp.]|uniref:hypothetical protein n=1 Tax=Terracidiphilus sp. TaxID=1964191 RepID=UPI003C1AC280
MRIPKTKGFVDAHELSTHFGDHGSDFSAPDASNYEAQADEFLSKPKSADMMECFRSKGDMVRFDKITLEYGVISKDGIIRTYYKPKKCSDLPSGERRVRCHRLSTHLEYAISTCSKH